MVRQIDVHGGVNTGTSTCRTRRRPTSWTSATSPVRQILQPGPQQRGRHSGGVAGEAFDRNWTDVAKDCDRIYAHERRL